ncbi:hypothetical protein J5Y03_10025 [Bacillus sp. RG28]|uniref:DUF4376 domain-containing protein n=1 Tax=Gottfriedia endophytica TaxID=2820819 RepID=A0A940SK19_9BACI|nr:hypothetical protein [Gottfriedia endophytica]MBP0725524.1 hypothetical protein [Gottfriedia endophytica]
MQIGRRIFFDIATGNVILDKGEMQGSVIETTVEQDIEVFKVLSERNRETFDYIQFEYGEFSKEFAECTSYRVNPTTKEIEFNHDPSFNLEQYKTFKIEELKKKCQEDIYNGFVSKLNNHTYRTNNDDQLNFLGKYNQLMSDTSIKTVMWKTEDVGYIEHTRSDWLSIYNEALTAKEQKLFHYEQLRQQVNACKTKEQVETILW